MSTQELPTRRSTRQNTATTKSKARLSALALYLPIAALAFIVRWNLGGGLAGVREYKGYDDGVYFSAAAAFTHGLLPYRDFTLLHPPGHMLALTPFAAMTEWFTDNQAMAIARIAFMLVGAANAVLIAHIAKRWSTSAAIVGGCLYAVAYTAAMTERTTLLEPLGTFTLLAGAALILRGKQPDAHKLWLWAGGAVLGYGMTIKIWGVVPAVIILAWLLVTVGWRPALRATIGATAAATAIMLPFAIASGPKMLNMVVLDQLGREHYALTKRRLIWLTGSQIVERGPSSQIWLAAAILIAVITAATLAWRANHGRLWVALLVIQSAVLFAAPNLFQHYASFATPALILVISAAVSLTTPRWRTTVAAASALAIVFSLAMVSTMKPEPSTFPAAAIKKILATEGCITADSPGTLITLNVLTRNIERGCQLPVDVTGFVYGPSSRTPTGELLTRPENLEWQNYLLGYLTSGDAMVLTRMNSNNGFNSESVRYLYDTTTTLFKEPGVQVRVPKQ